jgi:hypothetical protein
MDMAVGRIWLCWGPVVCGSVVGRRVRGA